MYLFLFFLAVVLFFKKGSIFFIPEGYFSAHYLFHPKGNFFQKKKKKSEYIFKNDVPSASWAFGVMRVFIFNLILFIFLI